MHLQHRIETLKHTTLVGMCRQMSFADNQTQALWKAFMPRRKLIRHITDSDLYSVEVYHNTHFFEAFDPAATFEKWAAVKVTVAASVPDEMNVLIIPEGLYAVFIHIGPASKGPETYQYIFGKWLPNSEYALDDRPHFALMGEEYKNDEPDSEEEIWIPLRLKNKS